MKKIIILICVVASIALGACKKDAAFKNTASYDGKWSLVFYNPSPMTGNANASTFNKGDIEWDFNASNQTVAVSVNPILSTVPLGPGNYAYQLGNHGCNYGSNQYITINAENEGVFVLDSLAANKLKITAECFDGSILKFER